LSCQGYAVRGVSRRPFGEHVYLDIACATRIESWLPLLDGIDTVVNCAGTLQDSPFESTRGVHVNGISALLTNAAMVARATPRNNQGEDGRSHRLSVVETCFCVSGMIEISPVASRMAYLI
jgi:hypothetical protein